MAWSGAALSSDYIAWAAEDKPLVGVKNILPDATTLQWRDSLFASATDGNESRAADGRTDLATTPAGAAAITWYFYINSAAPIDIDCAFVVFDNPAGDTITVSLEVADDSAFTINLQQLQNINATSKRASMLSFNDGTNNPSVISSAVYLRFRFYALFPDFKPVVREIFVGKRIQLEQNPLLPWDRKGLTGNVAKSVANNGAQQRYVYARGRREISANLNPWVDARADDIASIYTLSNHGTAPLIWVDEPTTTPHGFHLCHYAEPDLSMPYAAPFERNTTLAIEEQGPHYLALEV